MSFQIPRLMFVGAGNIAQSIMKGIIKAQPNAGSRIMATAPTDRNLSLIREQLGCQTRPINDYERIFTDFHPDYLFLCIKPQIFRAPDDTLTKLLRCVPENCVIMSLLAGIQSYSIKHATNHRIQVVRLMVNTAAAIGATSIFYYSEDDSIEERRVSELLSLFGRPVVRLASESLMDVATGICGSGIAFFYEAIQAFSDIGVRNGLTREQATQVAAQLSKSAGEMLQATGKHPCQLRDDVTSPAGTTIYGLQEWHAQGVNQKIAQSVQASIDRAKQLSL